MLNLEEVDTDEAVREAQDAISGDTRFGFLKKAGLAGAAAVSGGAVLSVFAGSAMAAGAPPVSPFGAGDVGILNYALTLEYLESSFYNYVASKGFVKNAQLKKLLKTTQTDENTHVKALKGALGSKAIAKPSFDFSKVTTEATFAATSYALENTGVHAYSGQAANIKSSAILLTALSIVTVEARHAGAIGLYLSNEGIDATGAFDTPYTASKVLSIATGTGFITKL